MAASKPLTGKQLANICQRAFVAAINKQARDTLAHAIPYTPKGPGGGRLRESGHVVPMDTAMTRDATIVFDLVYADAQHEGWAIMHGQGGVTWVWEAKHYTTPGTGKKFLERALKERAPTHQRDLATLTEQLIAASVREAKVRGFRR